MALKLKENQIRRAQELDTEVRGFSLKGECCEKMRVGICAENIRRGLNKDPRPPACLQILITHPRRQSAFLTLPLSQVICFNAFTRACERALKRGKQARDLIFTQQMKASVKPPRFINMENITGAQHKENHMEYFFCSICGSAANVAEKDPSSSSSGC